MTAATGTISERFVAAILREGLRIKVIPIGYSAEMVSS